MRRPVQGPGHEGWALARRPCRTYVGIDVDSAGWRLHAEQQRMSCCAKRASHHLGGQFERTRQRDYGNLGSQAPPPYITLSGDSKVAGMETVVIHRPDALRYILFCSYSALSNGFGPFKSFGAHVGVDNGAGERIEVPLHEKGSTVTGWPLRSST